MLSLVLTMVLAAQAQLKVAPKMMMGDRKVYATTVVTEIPGQGTVTVNDETSISVTGVSADGCTIEMETTKVTSDAAANNVTGQIIAAAQELMAGMPVRVATDADGKPLRIENYQEVKEKALATSDKLIEKMTAAIPQLEQVMSKDALRQQLLENLSEENLLQAMTAITNPLALNGKTIMTGAQEDYTNSQGLKMKRMYFVNGKNVTTNGSLNMTKEDMKKLIIAQVEKIMPEQADMVKQNIDQVMESGMLKMDAKETASYELGDDGWVKSIKAETTTESMGQTVKATSTTTLK